MSAGVIKITTMCATLHHHGLHHYILCVCVFFFCAGGRTVFFPLQMWVVWWRWTYHREGRYPRMPRSACRSVRRSCWASSRASILCCAGEVYAYTQWSEYSFFLQWKLSTRNCDQTLLKNVQLDHHKHANGLVWSAFPMSVVIFCTHACVPGFAQSTAWSGMVEGWGLSVCARTFMGIPWLAVYQGCWAMPEGKTQDCDWRRHPVCYGYPRIWQLHWTTQELPHQIQRGTYVRMYMLACPTAPQLEPQWSSSCTTTQLLQKPSSSQIAWRIWFGVYLNCTLPTVPTHMAAVLKQQGLTCYAPTAFTCDTATSILCNDVIGLQCAIDQV